jgi:hypothetical protein
MSELLSSTQHNHKSVIYVTQNELDAKIAEVEANRAIAERNDAFEPLTQDDADSKLADRYIVNEGDGTHVYDFEFRYTNVNTRFGVKTTKVYNSYLELDGHQDPNRIHRLYDNTELNKMVGAVLPAFNSDANNDVEQFLAATDPAVFDGSTADQVAAYLGGTEPENVNYNILFTLMYPDSVEELEDVQCRFDQLRAGQYLHEQSSITDPLEADFNLGGDYDALNAALIPQRGIHQILGSNIDADAIKGISEGDRRDLMLLFLWGTIGDTAQDKGKLMPSKTFNIIEDVGDIASAVAGLGMVEFQEDAALAAANNEFIQFLSAIDTIKPTSIPVLKGYLQDAKDNGIDKIVLQGFADSDKPTANELRRTGTTTADEYNRKLADSRAAKTKAMAEEIWTAGPPKGLGLDIRDMPILEITTSEIGQPRGERGVKLFFFQAIGLEDDKKRQITSSLNSSFQSYATAKSRHNDSDATAAKGAFMATMNTDISPLGSAAPFTTQLYLITENSFGSDDELSKALAAFAIDELNQITDNNKLNEKADESIGYLEAAHINTSDPLYAEILAIKAAHPASSSGAASSGSGTFAIANTTVSFNASAVEIPTFTFNGDSSDIDHIEWTGVTSYGPGEGYTLSGSNQISFPWVATKADEYNTLGTLQNGATFSIRIVLKNGADNIDLIAKAKI